jgi:hypothetical protein
MTTEIALHRLNYLSLIHDEIQRQLNAINAEIRELQISLAGPRCPSSVPPLFGSQVIAFTADGTPHLVNIMENWKEHFWEQGYVEWAEIPGK